MEEVLDALLRIITRWLKTVVPLTEDANIGDTTLTVRNTNRFKIGDEIVIRGPTTYEKPNNLRVTQVVDNTHLTISAPIQAQKWTVSSGSVVQKLVHGNLVQGIYLGDPENISDFPAITVNAISETTNEWLTLNSVKNEYNVEIGIYVEDSTQEEGFRFLLRTATLVKFALMSNIFPLISDYYTTAVTADYSANDQFVKVADSSIFTCGSIILMEDIFKTREARVDQIIDANTIQLNTAIPIDFAVADGTILISVRRFIYNSYPKSIQWGKVHKGTLLKAAVLDWFGFEDVIPPQGGQGWIDTQLK